MGFRPDAASRDYNREKSPRTEPELSPSACRTDSASEPLTLSEIPLFYCKKQCMHNVHGFACVSPTLNPPPAPAVACPEAVNAPALKAPC
ncbi:hypothetical protein [Cronobacter dublinensis]|uniref:hypothetical protein n=1 Tax=Cronobacter dublinensis TaxID=413497 RepID=UPI00300DC853